MNAIRAFLMYHERTLTLAGVALIFLFVFLSAAMCGG